MTAVTKCAARGEIAQHASCWTQNAAFFIPHCPSSAEFGITGYAGSASACRYARYKRILLHHVITVHQRYEQVTLRAGVGTELSPSPPVGLSVCLSVCLFVG